MEFGTQEESFIMFSRMQTRTVSKHKAKHGDIPVRTKVYAVKKIILGLWELHLHTKKMDIYLKPS